MLDSPSKVVDQTGSRVVPNVSIETSLLVEFFKPEKPGFEATYGRMRDLIGRDVQDPRYRGYLASARRILLREHGMVIDVVRNVGARVCTDDQKVNAAARDMGGARRALRRASSKLEVTDMKALSDEKRKEYLARGSLIGGLQLLAAPSSVKRILREGGQELLPSAKVLGLFQT